MDEPKFACLSGFGQVNGKGQMPNRLQFANIKVWLRKICIRYLPYIGREGMVCAGDKSGQPKSCYGDSGSPLVLDGKLYGIVSFGFGCGTPNTPSVFTYVPLYRCWIEKYVKL